jgi:hypothetical protein
VGNEVREVGGGELVGGDNFGVEKGAEKYHVGNGTRSMLCVKINTMASKGRFGRSCDWLQELLWFAIS